MAKYTPGKWEAQQQKNIASGKYEWVIKVKENEVSDRIIATTPYAKKFNDHEANARLISAAPELLATCKNVLRQLEQVYENGNPKTEGLCLSIRGLKGTIAKAEGR